MARKPRRRKARRRGASGLAARLAAAARTCTGARRAGSAWTRATRSNARFASRIGILAVGAFAPAVLFLNDESALLRMRLARNGAGFSCRAELMPPWHPRAPALSPALFDSPRAPRP